MGYEALERPIRRRSRHSWMAVICSLGPDQQMNRADRQVQARGDAEAYPKYEQMLERVAAVVEPTIIQVPPNLIKPGIAGCGK